MWPDCASPQASTRSMRSFAGYRGLRSPSRCSGTFSTRRSMSFVRAANSPRSLTGRVSFCQPVFGFLDGFEKASRRCIAARRCGVICRLHLSIAVQNRRLQSTGSPPKSIDAKLSRIGLSQPLRFDLRVYSDRSKTWEADDSKGVDHRQDWHVVARRSHPETLGSKDPAFTCQPRAPPRIHEPDAKAQPSTPASIA